MLDINFMEGGGNLKPLPFLCHYPVASVSAPSPDEFYYNFSASKNELISFFNILKI